MDKYEFNIKVEQIKKMTAKGDYETAMKIADGIDWRRVRNANLLSSVAEIYEQNREYEEAKDILLLAFERAPVGKRLLYKLSEISVEAGDIQDAEDFYREFCEISPDDSRQYLLRYMILKAKGAPAEQLINSLEQYSATDVDEKWLYELAVLYSKAGKEDACIRTCDKIMLLFGLGKYVDKAMELKLQYAPLTKQQMDLVENRDKYEEKLKRVEQEFGDAEDYDDSADAGVYAQQADTVPQTQTEAAYQIAHADTVDRIGAHSGETTQNAGAQQLDGQADADGALNGLNAAQPEEAAGNAESGAAGTPVGAALSADGKAADARTASHAAEQIRPVRREVEESILHAKEKARELVSQAVSEARAGQEAARQDAVVTEDSHAASYGSPQAQVEADVNSPASTAAEKKPYHMIIEAKTMEEGLNIAIDELKYFHEQYGVSNKVAKTNAEKLNTKGFSVFIPKLTGKDLIIEHAGDLSLPVIDEIGDYVDQLTQTASVVLVDVIDHFDALAEARPAFIEKFDIVSDADDDDADDDLFEDIDLNETQQSDGNGGEANTGAPADTGWQVANGGYTQPSAGAQTYADDASAGYTSENEQDSAGAGAAAENTAYADQQTVDSDASDADAYAGQDDAQADTGHYEAHGYGEQAGDGAYDNGSYETDGQYDENGQYEEEPYGQDGSYEDDGQYEDDQYADGAYDDQYADDSAYEDEQYDNDQQYDDSYDDNDTEENLPADYYDPMDIDDFATYAQQYAKHIDCVMPGKTVLALYEKIEMMEEDDVPLTKATAEEMIEEAADKAEKPSLGKRLTGMFSSKYDKDGHLILKEEHFV